MSHDVKTVQDPITLNWYELCECEHERTGNGYISELKLNRPTNDCPHYRE